MIYHRYYERSSLRSTLLQGLCLSEAGKSGKIGKNQGHRPKSILVSESVLVFWSCNCRFWKINIDLGFSFLLLEVYVCWVYALRIIVQGGANTTHSFRGGHRPCKRHTALNHPWAVEDIGSSLCRDTMWTPCGHCSYRMHIECYW